MSEASEILPGGESPKTPEQEIKEMGRRILGAIDEIIEERGWGWSKKPRSEIPLPSSHVPDYAQQLRKYNLLTSPLSLSRRFDPKNFGSNFQEEAFCMAQVLGKGIIPKIQYPGKKEPLPYGILINFRAAPEFYISGWYSDDLDAEGGDVYKKRACQVMEDLLKKLGFQANFWVTPEELSDPSTKVVRHNYFGYRGTGQYVSSVPGRKSDYSWIIGSDREGYSFTEIQHPALPFVADVIENPDLMPPLGITDREPPLVFIRYIAPLESLRLSNRDKQKAIMKREREELPGKKLLILEDAKKAKAIQLILGKQEILTHAMTQFPNIAGQKGRFIADLGNGSELFEESGFYSYHLKDQAMPECFDCTFLRFSTPEEGAKHPYTRGVETDNLLMLNRRGEVDQPWESGTYLITPDGVLLKFQESARSTATPVKSKEEFDLISSTFDFLTKRLEQYFSLSK